MGGVSLDGV